MATKPSGAGIVWLNGLLTVEKHRDTETGQRTVSGKTAVAFSTYLFILTVTIAPAPGRRLTVKLGLFTGTTCPFTSAVSMRCSAYAPPCTTIERDSDLFKLTSVTEVRTSVISEINAATSSGRPARFRAGSK